jgi:hypothetical protein
MDQLTRASGVRLALAATLFMICGWAWMSPLPAFAQSLPMPGGGGGGVSITSPPSGARVSGTITVPASATTPLGVSGVQFKLDGVNLGAEDTTAPYSVVWDTTTAADGWHTLTAAARDSSGFQYVSDPVTVTVANTPAPATPVKRHEETDASVSYSSGGWIQGDTGWSWSGGTAAISVMPGAQATFTFTGTSVTWIGQRSGDRGIARVYVDGVYVSDVDLFSRTTEVRVPVFTMSGLTNSRHALTIEVTGLKNQESLVADSAFAAVVVDAFDVPGLPVSRLQETDPAITYTDSWTEGDLSFRWSAGSAASSSIPGAQAALTFNGTSVTWIGYRGPDSGTARVYVDGNFAGEVDLYSPTQRAQDSLFTATGLADASHALAIKVTGRKNAASTGTSVQVDAFDVTTPGTRFEEADWSVSYSGEWERPNRDRAWSGGTAAESNAAGSQARFTFTGTSVSWIGACGPITGIARVYLDGRFVTEVDTYSSTEAPQKTVFTATGLARRSHTLTIELTGRKNPASTETWVLVDAFDVRP